MGIRYLKVSTTLKFEDGISVDDRRDIQDDVVDAIQNKWDSLLPADFEILDHVTGGEWCVS